MRIRMMESDPKLVRFTIEHCQHPIPDETLLEEAADLLEEDHAEEVRGHLRECVTCGLRAKKAHAWLAARKAEVCPTARSLFRPSYEGTLAPDRASWLEDHLLVCTECWEAYEAFMEACEAETAAAARRETPVRDVVRCVLGRLKISRLLPIPTVESQAFAYAAAPAGSEVQAAHDVQEFDDPEHEVKAIATLDERDHLIIQVLRGMEPAAGVTVELVETAETDSCAKYSATTDQVGVADFGPLADLPAPPCHPYMVRVSIGEHGVNEELHIMATTKSKTLYEKEPRLKELEDKGIIRAPLREKASVPRPPRLPGRPLSEYLDEVRGE